MVFDPAVMESLRDVAGGKPVLVTGCAGFIGYFTSKNLLENGIHVVGLDNLSDYYDVDLKKHRLEQLSDPNFVFHCVDISDQQAVARVFKDVAPRLVIHLAAQPGVRYSLINPQAYGKSNLVGSLNLLEACRQIGARHFVFASSSSVYGANTQLPYSVHDRVDQPVSMYAATKKSCELMAHAYSHLYEIPTTGLRFFTVYGPWGRPDMAYFSFTRSILAGATIKVFNHGDMRRDFTFIDDIIEGVLRVCARPPVVDDNIAPYRLYNIGNNRPEKLTHLIELLERQLGKQAKKEYLPMQPGDVKETYADISDLEKEFGYRPSTSLEDGLRKFVDWYREYYGER